MVADAPEEGGLRPDLPDAGDMGDGGVAAEDGAGAYDGAHGANQVAALDHEVASVAHLGTA